MQIFTLLRLQHLRLEDLTLAEIAVQLVGISLKDEEEEVKLFEMTKSVTIYTKGLLWYKQQKN